MGERFDERDSSEGQQEKIGKEGEIQSGPGGRDSSHGLISFTSHSLLGKMARPLKICGHWSLDTNATTC